MGLKKINVLVIDDDEDDYLIIRDILSKNLTTIYNTIWADSFESGMEKLSTTECDICLCDYSLGSKNGIEFIQKASATLRQVPIILLTGLNEEFIDIEALRAGAADYLQKNQLNAQVLERAIRYARERKKTEEELFREKEQILVTLESIGEAVITTNKQKEITHINRIGEELVGMRLEDLKGNQFNEVICIYNETTEAPVVDVLSETIYSDKIVRLNDNYIMTNKNDTVYAIEATVSPIHDRNEQVIGTITVILDVTRTRELTKKISYQATHDALTGLINRTSFELFCSNIFSAKDESSEGNILFYMDMDGFKIINDTCGHLAGDQLLKSIPDIFKKNIRKSDVCGRLGGDEFGIILRSCSIDKAILIAEKICEDIRAYQFTWFERVFTISMSIGITPINPLEADSIYILLQQADEACYYAKNKGGNSCHVFSSKDITISGMYGERNFALALNEALQSNNISLYYQPIVLSLEEQKEERVEVLVRICDVHGKIILPGAFLPAASRYKLLTALDKKVIETLFKGLNSGKFNQTGSSFNINLSGPTMNDHSFINYVEEMMNKYSINPESICFEIMETVAIDCFKTTIEFIKKLKILGCQFAIDDFGSGVTTFTYIKLLPVDYIKIDRTFIQNCLENKVDETIIESIVRIAKLLNIKTVAEGVENKEIYSKIQELGVDYIQGFFIAKPAPLE